MGFEQSFELFHALWRADVAGKRVPKLGAALEKVLEPKDLVRTGGMVRRCCDDERSGRAGT